MPKSGVSMSVRQKRPTTTGASTIGRIATTRNAHCARGMRRISRAIANPSTSWSVTVTTV